MTTIFRYTLGRFRGQFLHWIDSPGSRRLPVRVLDTAFFRALPFGLDFISRA